MKATARIYLLKAKSKQTKEGLCPVKLVITYNRQRRYYSVDNHIFYSLKKYPAASQEWAYLSESDFERAKGENPRGKYRDISDWFDEIKNKAKGIINEMEIFSFEKFEKRLYGQKSNWNNVFDAFEDYIKELQETRRYGYAVSFKSTLTNLKAFTKEKKKSNSLSFVDIDPSLLEVFEQWLLDNDKSESTVGVYGRNIRRLFNLAIQRHGIKVEYPFGSTEAGKYSPPQGQGNKTALTAQQIAKIASYKPLKDSPKEFYRDLFMFSFLANGMNLADIFRLKYRNIENGTITFIREKTKRKSRGKKISVEITQRMQEIIEKWGNQELSKDIYVFNVLNGEQSEDQQYYLIRQQTKLLNKYIKEIAGEVGIKQNVSSYTARHSFATIQKNAGVPVSYLKEALGHSDVSVTENYLKDLEKDQRKKIAEDLEKQVYGDNLKIS